MTKPSMTYTMKRLLFALSMTSLLLTAGCAQKPERDIASHVIPIDVFDE